MRLKPLRRSPEARGTPLRVKPEHGRPRCVLEQFAQHVWTHKLAWYIALMVTLAVALQLGLGDDIHDLVYR